jgi:drug/metabolite transporter (DMT)-like permease
MFAASVGQVLFKSGLMQVGTINQFDLPTILNILFNRYIEVGLLLYVISFGLWFYALSKKDLIYVYPFTALTFVFVSVMSVFILGETISKQGIIAYALIVIGILLLTQS